MKIPLNEISTPGLLRLLRDVAAELEARHNAPAVQHVQATRPVETVRVPPEDDADFCLMIAARVKAGGYVKAGERERVAPIDKVVHNRAQIRDAVSFIACPTAGGGVSKDL